MWWKKYERCKFEEKGRGPLAFDCWGLLKWVYENDHPDKIILPGYEWCYEKTTDRDRLAKAIFDERQERWKQVESPREFDAVLLRMRGVPMHVGIATKDCHMLHCSMGIGTTYEPFNGLRWKDKVMGFYRYE